MSLTCRKSGPFPPSVWPLVILCLCCVCVHKNARQGYAGGFSNLWLVCTCAFMGRGSGAYHLCLGGLLLFLYSCRRRTWSSWSRPPAWASLIRRTQQTTQWYVGAFHSDVSMKSVGTACTLVCVLCKPLCVCVCRETSELLMTPWLFCKVSLRSSLTCAPEISGSLGSPTVVRLCSCGFPAFSPPWSRDFVSPGACVHLD